MESQDQNLQRVMEQIVVFLVDVTGLQTGRRLCFRVRSRGGKPCIAGTGSMSGWSPGDWSEGFAGGPLPAHGSSQETEFEVACRRGVGSRLSLKVTCWRWGGVGTSYTAGAGSAFRRVWERGKLVEKAKTVSRSVIQQRTVEQIVDLPVAKVVELVPQMVVQLVDVPKTLSRDRIRQRADERIDDIPVPKVLEARVEERILDCMVEQIAEVIVPQMGERVSERIVEQIAEVLVPGRSASRSVSWNRSPIFLCRGRESIWWKCYRLCLESKSSSELTSRSSTCQFRRGTVRNSWRSLESFQRNASRRVPWKRTPSYLCRILESTWLKCQRLCFETESGSELTSRSTTGHFGKEWRISWRSARFSRESILERIVEQIVDVPKSSLDEASGE